MEKINPIAKWFLGVGFILLGACTQTKQVVDPNIPLQDESVRVVGRMFSWEITQSGPDGVLGSDDDIHVENQIVVPVNTRLKILLESSDVVHGFFMPSLKVRKTLVPKVVQSEELVLTTPGTYRFACSEVCGPGHGKMMGQLVVLPLDKYRHWLQAISAKSPFPPKA